MNLINITKETNGNKFGISINHFGLWKCQICYVGNLIKTVFENLLAIISLQLKIVNFSPAF